MSAFKRLASSSTGLTLNPKPNPPLVSLLASPCPSPLLRARTRIRIQSLQRVQRHFKIGSLPIRLGDAFFDSPDVEIPNGFFPGQIIFRDHDYQIPAVWRTATPRTILLLPELRGYVDGQPGTKKEAFIKPIITQGGSMKSTVQIISTPTADTPAACLILHTNNAGGKRYLFGQISEGTQRYMNQNKVRMGGIGQIFLSGPIDWSSAGGLLGMILSIADVNKLDASSTPEEGGASAHAKRKGQAAEPEMAPLHVWGAKHLMHMFASARVFIFRKSLPLRLHEIQDDPRQKDASQNKPDYEDEYIRVWNLLIAPGPPPATPDALRGQREVDQIVRETIVQGMFEPQWSAESLTLTDIHQVRRGTKVYIKGEDGKIEEYLGPMPPGPGDHAGIPNSKVWVRQPWPSTQATSLPAPEPFYDSLCYLVKAQPRRGKFDIAKATALKLPIKDYKRVIRGESVMVGGVEITNEMIVGKTIEGEGFGVFDIRRTDLIDSFLARPEWENETIMRGINVMYWFLSPEVRDDSRLIAFMRARPKVKHFILGPAVGANPLAFTSATNQIIKMHQIDPERFPIPIHSNEEAELPPDLAAAAVRGQRGETLQLAPRLEFQDKFNYPIMNTRLPVDEMLHETEILSLAKAARKKIADPDFIKAVEESQKDIPNLDTEIIPLGTGSCLPSKYRNVSATLVRVPGHGNYLLDCGEGTLGQIRRSFGPEADEIIENLRMIWISHMHADHHLGISSVLAWRSELVKKNNTLQPLAVVGPGPINTFIEEYGGIQDLGSGAHLKRVSCYWEQSWNEITLEGLTEAQEVIDLPSIEICNVDHCRDAFAVALTWSSGLRIAYSGDCRPSTKFATMGKGAHLLIHECTFDNELEGEARAKKHSTMGEALKIGRLMEARRVLLTHFSQRYPKLPSITDVRKEIRSEETPVLFAFDCMRVKLGEFKEAEAFLPALKALYEGDEGEGEVLDEDEGEVLDEPSAIVAERTKKRAKKEKKEKKGKKGAEANKELWPEPEPVFGTTDSQQTASF
ncbi:hypothetical protein B0H67DRAFT_583597 [Lasiosphaeris hirsuta]|uniref:ribonuclease Z n=1 Tax=Lasiosphaeris hirsuta TaxID=260670 RepID=A0AA40DPJ5_9PEZI|nr:hypothetical protein B0H67DRAFT_583597 [Lasiosphaeris hirsuta]